MMNSADCLIIGGTSLEVGSASQLAHLFHGDHLIIINKGKQSSKEEQSLYFMTVLGKCCRHYKQIKLLKQGDTKNALDSIVKHESNVYKKSYTITPRFDKIQL